LTPLFQLGKTSSLPNSYSEQKIHRLQGLPERKELLAQNLRPEEQVLDMAVQHAASVHGHENAPKLRAQIKSMLKDERD
jgi:hypothetical protein